MGGGEENSIYTILNISFSWVNEIKMQVLLGLQWPALQWFCIACNHRVLSITWGKSGEGDARIIEKHGYSKTYTLLSHKQNIKL